VEMASMELATLEPKKITTEFLPAAITPNGNLSRLSTRPSALAAQRLKVWWRFMVSRAAPRRKSLSVRETAALGDRRFVSVIQFEGLRFLVGSSPSSVALLAQLPDEPASRNENPEKKESKESKERKERN